LVRGLLLTQQVWQLVQAYARRWQIEQSFRFYQIRAGMESCRLWFWKNKMKRLQIVALVKLFCLRFRKEPTGAHPQLAPNELP